MVLTIWPWYASCWIIQKSLKMHFWMIQRAKKEVFGHFLEFGLSDWLDLAYCGSTKYSTTCANTTRSWRVVQESQKCIFEWSKEQKTMFLAIFLSLVCWDGLDMLLVWTSPDCLGEWCHRGCDTRALEDALDSRTVVDLTRLWRKPISTTPTGSRWQAIVLNGEWCWNLVDFSKC